jgi:hypothetical protein
VFSTRSVAQLTEAEIELLGEVFSVRPVPSCYKLEKSRI